MAHPVPPQPPATPAAPAHPHGRVGPDHARKPAELKILETPLATHEIVTRIRPLDGAPAAVNLPEGQAPLGHRLYVAVPKTPAPAAGWPIIYLLDGNAVFDYLTPEHLAAVPGLVVVGVGYDTDRQFARERRTFDFTPPDPAAPQADATGLRPDHVHEGRMAGGAEAFLDLLLGDLRQLAEAGLTIDPARRTLWGHSFGGLFTLHALLSRPQAFTRFAAISPSVWWDEALMRRLVAQSAALQKAPPFLLALGDREHRSGSDAPPPDGPAPATIALIEAMASHPGIPAELHVLAGHRHIETIAGSLPLALPFAAR